MTIPTNKVARLFCDECDECFRVEIPVFGDTEVIPNCPECNEPLSGPGVFNPECACNDHDRDPSFVIFDDPILRPRQRTATEQKALYDNFLVLRDQGK